MMKRNKKKKLESTQSQSRVFRGRNLCKCI